MFYLFQLIGNLHNVHVFVLQEELEESLDAVEKELGSLRMSLKRCNVLKTAA